MSSQQLATPAQEVPGAFPSDIEPESQQVRQTAPIEHEPQHVQQTAPSEPEPLQVRQTAPAAATSTESVIPTWLSNAASTAAEQAQQVAAQAQQVAAQASEAAAPYVAQASQAAAPYVASLQEQTAAAAQSARDAVAGAPTADAHAAALNPADADMVVGLPLMTTDSNVNTTTTNNKKNPTIEAGVSDMAPGPVKDSLARSHQEPPEAASNPVAIMQKHEVEGELREAVYDRRHRDDAGLQEGISQSLAGRDQTASKGDVVPDQQQRTPPTTGLLATLSGKEEPKRAAPRDTVKPGELFDDKEPLGTPGVAIVGSTSTERAFPLTG